MVKKVLHQSTYDYLKADWNSSFKPHLNRAILEMDSVWAVAEAKREGRAYTPLYWNEVSVGKWLYSLWEIR